MHPNLENEYPMKRFLQAFCGLVVALSMLTSCLSSSDEDTTTYNDVVITSFKLGTLHTTSKSGADSVFKATYSASNFKMNIDQLNDTIYNADSLLVGTDVAHVVCTVTTKNSGIVFLKSMTSDSLTYFSSGSDSVDFTRPRVFRVYANDGSCFRDYKVSVTASQQTAGTFLWTVADKAGFPAVDDAAERSAAEAAGLIYLGKTVVEAYALTSDGRMMETEDHGETWKEDVLDTDGTLLPTKGLAFTSWVLDDLTDYALLVGQNAADDTAMTQWRKLADYDMEGKWVYMPLATDNHYYLPVMDYVALAYYNKSILAFGSDGNIYVSRDQGITWKTSSAYAYPDGFAATTGYEVAVDDDGWLWLTDTAGNTWKGRLTK